MNSGIYLITNTITGKKYIGQSKGIKKRLQRHIRAASSKKKGESFYLHNAISKYGIENFKFETIIYATNSEYLNLMEQKCIESFNTLAPNGYNLDTGGQFNKSFSEATIEKLKGRTPWNKGKKMPPEFGQKVSKSCMGRIGNNKGGIRTEEQKRKQSEKMKGRIPGNKGLPMTEEQKQKMKLVDKSYTKTPEYRKKMSESKKKNGISPEHRAKINAALRLRAEKIREQKGQ